MATGTARNASSHARSMPQRRRARYRSVVLPAALFAAYLVIVGPWLQPAMASDTIELAGVGMLLLALGIAVLMLLSTVLITLTVAVWSRTRVRVLAWLRRLRHQLIAVVALMLVLAFAVLSTQWLAYTPSILGTGGRPLPGSIATIQRVQLGGFRSWQHLAGGG